MRTMWSLSWFSPRMGWDNIARGKPQAQPRVTHGRQIHPERVRQWDVWLLSHSFRVQIFCGCDPGLRQLRCLAPGYVVPPHSG